MGRLRGGFMSIVNSFNKRLEKREQRTLDTIPGSPVYDPSEMLKSQASQDVDVKGLSALEREQLIRDQDKNESYRQGKRGYAGLYGDEILKQAERINGTFEEQPPAEVDPFASFRTEDEKEKKERPKEEGPKKQKLPPVENPPGTVAPGGVKNAIQWSSKEVLPEDMAREGGSKHYEAVLEVNAQDLQKLAERGVDVSQIRQDASEISLASGMWASPGEYDETVRDED